MEPLTLLRKRKIAFPAARLVLLLTAVFLPGAWNARAASQSFEQAVKANFLFKFAPFVEWPVGAEAASKPFAICLRGDDGFGGALDEVVRGQKLSGRAVQVRRLSDGGSANGCQMLFAGRSSAAGYAPFAEVAGQPVLTVSDQKNGVPGAMIEFVMQSGRVRFQIDDAAARASGLVISSKLLGLAVAVAR